MPNSLSETLKLPKAVAILRYGFVASIVLHLGLLTSLAITLLPASAPDTVFYGTGSSNQIVLYVDSIEASQPPAQPIQILSPLTVSPDHADLESERYVRATSKDVSPEFWDQNADIAALLKSTSPIEPPNVTKHSSAKPIAQVTKYVMTVAPTTIQQPLEIEIPAAATVPAQTIERQELAGDKEAQLTPPSFVGNRPPTYPEKAKRNRWEGLVLLDVHLDASGQVTRVAILKSSGFSILDAAAVRTVRSWSCKPAMRNGQPVAGSWEFPVRFRL